MMKFIKALLKLAEKIDQLTSIEMKVEQNYQANLLRIEQISKDLQETLSLIRKQEYAVKEISDELYSLKTIILVKEKETTEGDYLSKIQI